MAEAPGNPAAVAAPAAGDTKTPAAGDGKAPAAPAAGDGKTIVGDGTEAKAVADKAAADAADAAKWPEDWREQVAGTDDKQLKRLQRYNTPGDAMRALGALQVRINSGELRSKKPKDADEATVTKWREENGLPADAKGYDIKVDDKQITVDGKAVNVPKAILPMLLDTSHALDLSQDQVKGIVKFWSDTTNAQVEARNESDAKYKDDQIDVLTNDWGADFKPNLARANAIFAMLPKEVTGLLVGGRLADGTPIGSNAGVLKAFAELHRMYDPSSTLTRDGDGNAGGNITDRIAAIEKIMRDDRPTYNKDEAMQAELRNLYAARDRGKEREAA